MSRPRAAWKGRSSSAPPAPISHVKRGAGAVVLGLRRFFSLQQIPYPHTIGETPERKEVTLPSPSRWFAGLAGFWRFFFRGVVGGMAVGRGEGLAPATAGLRPGLEKNCKSPANPIPP